MYEHEKRIILSKLNADSNDCRLCDKVFSSSKFFTLHLFSFDHFTMYFLDTIKHPNVSVAKLLNEGKSVDYVLLTYFNLFCNHMTDLMKKFKLSGESL